MTRRAGECVPVRMATGRVAACATSWLVACGSPSTSPPAPTDAEPARTDAGPPGASRAHRPANFTASAGFDFSGEVPAGPPPDGDRAIAGSNGWAVIYDGAEGPGSNFSRDTDATAPASGPDVWQLHWAPGAYGGGVIGQGDGHGAGNVFYFPPNPTALYGSIWIKFDPSYAFHPISNKFVFFEPDGALIQLKESNYWLHGEVLGAGVWLDPDNTDTPDTVELQTWKNDAISVGDWHEIEFVVDRSAGTFSIWLDGDQKTHASAIEFPGPTFSTFNLTGFRGGGGETLDRDMYWTYDDVFLAWPE